MYYDFDIPLPDDPDKLVYERHGSTTYIKYKYDRICDPEKKFTYPKRAIIGKRSKEKSYDSTNKNSQAGDIKIA